MSYVSIAAALGIQGVPVGERLVAFSLASFANREHQVWPGTPAAAARAGLSERQYLAARRGLEQRDLVEVVSSGRGRGRSTVLALRFVEADVPPARWINFALFEAVLSHSRARGPARLLLAALAAFADQDRRVIGVPTEELRAAAGLSDRAYRRARALLLTSGGLQAEECRGGRGVTNRWTLPDPRALDPAAPPRRVAPPAGARPLIADLAQNGKRAATNPGPDRTVATIANPGPERAFPVGNPGPDRTFSSQNPGPDRTFSPGNPGPDRTFSDKTPAHTPAETPAPYARAGTEPENHITNPPDPPKGGHPPALVTVIEERVSPHGRRRRRAVSVDLAQLATQLDPPSESDRATWSEVRSRLAVRVGEVMFDVWLARLEPCAVDADGVLLLACASATRGWTVGRFGSVIDECAELAGVRVHLAGEAELAAAALLPAVARSPSRPVPVTSDRVASPRLLDPAPAATRPGPAAAPGLEPDCGAAAPPALVALTLDRQEAV